MAAAVRMLGAENLLPSLLRMHHMSINQELKIVASKLFSLNK